VYEYRFKTDDAHWSERREATVFKLFGLANKTQTSNDTVPNGDTSPHGVDHASAAHAGVVGVEPQNATHVVVTLQQLKADIDQRTNAAKEKADKIDQSRSKANKPAVARPGMHRESRHVQRSRYSGATVQRTTYNRGSAQKPTATTAKQTSGSFKKKNAVPSIVVAEEANPFLLDIMDNKIKQAQADEDRELAKQQAQRELQEKKTRDRAKLALKLATKASRATADDRQAGSKIPRPPACRSSGKRSRTRKGGHARSHRRQQPKQRHPLGPASGQLTSLPEGSGQDAPLPKRKNTQWLSGRRCGARSRSSVRPSSRNGNLASGGGAFDSIDPENTAAFAERFYGEQSHAIFSPSQQEAVDKIFRSATESSPESIEPAAISSNAQVSARSHTHVGASGAPAEPSTPAQSSDTRAWAYRVMTFKQFETCLSKRFHVERDAYLIKRVYAVMCGPATTSTHSDDTTGLTLAKLSRVLSLCAQGSQQLRLYFCFAAFDADGDGVLSHHDVFNLLRWNVDEVLRQDTSHLIEWVHQHHSDNDNRVEATQSPSASARVASVFGADATRSAGAGGFGPEGEHHTNNKAEGLARSPRHTSAIERGAMRIAGEKERKLSISFKAFRKLWPRRTVPVLVQYVSECFGVKVVGQKADQSPGWRSHLAIPKNPGTSNTNTNTTDATSPIGSAAVAPDAITEKLGRVAGSIAAASLSNGTGKLNFKGVLGVSKAKKGLMELIKMRKVGPAQFVKKHTTDHFLARVGVSVAEAEMLAANFQTLVTSARDTCYVDKFCSVLCKVCERVSKYVRACVRVCLFVCLIITYYLYWVELLCQLYSRHNIYTCNRTRVCVFAMQHATQIHRNVALNWDGSGVRCACAESTRAINVHQTSFPDLSIYSSAK
jgi:hypothetical protein